MTDQHPITPPPELVQQWRTEGYHQDYCSGTEHVATQAARWGSDQELEACCKLLELSDPNAREFLYSARRPKPPNLKEQAMKALDDAVYMADDIPPEGISTDQANIIRRALEALDD